MFSTHKEMLDAVFPKFGATLKKDGFERKYAAREVRISDKEAECPLHGDCQFDLVEYDKEKQVFRVIEFKLGHHQAVIPEAFSQVQKYRQALEANAHTFLDAFTRKSPMRFGRLMESTCGATKISIEFYVGLTDQACEENQEFLRSFKEKWYPYIGTVRVKDDGKIKHFIKNPDGRKDYEIARARAVSFSLAWGPVTNAFGGEPQVSMAASENELRPTSC